MSSEQVEKALRGSNGFVSFVRPVAEKGSLSDKLSHLMDLIKVHAAIEGAREEARLQTEKQRERRAQVPHTGGFL